jgi:hypothetical protein
MGNRKYSENFERDYTWYLKYKDIFTFSGSIDTKEYKEGNKSAKECFYIYDSKGRLEGCSEIELLKQIFKCKESINFQIKQWAEGMIDYNTFGIVNIDFFLNEKDLVWNKDGTFTKMSIMEQYELLPWMVKAIQNQINKLVKIC